MGRVGGRARRLPCTSATGTHTLIRSITHSLHALRQRLPPMLSAEQTITAAGPIRCEDGQIHHQRQLGPTGRSSHIASRISFAQVAL